MPRLKPVQARSRYILARFLNRRWPPLAKLYGLSKRGFPFMWPGRQDCAMRRLRGHLRRGMYAHLPPWRRFAARAAMTLTWPFGALVDTVYNLAHAKCPNAVDCLRRGGHMLALALGSNVMPLEYRTYRLHEPAKRGWADDYLYWSDDHLFRMLNSKTGADLRDVQDKSRFADICRQHGLPCIPTLAAYRRGGQFEPAEPYLPQAPDLWVKDLAGKQGSGAAEWRREEGGYRDGQGQMRTAQELVAAWRGRDCIVQPMLRNHPALDDLSCGLLVNCRILTGIDPAGEVHVITHDITLPWGGWDNRPYFVFGKIGDDGRIARAMTGDGVAVTCHPDTGATIPGAEIPFWPDALALAQLAHRAAFSRFVFLGWDVALTADGPLLIEANAGPGVFHHQQLDGRPLGHTLFPEIALAYIEAGADTPCD